MTQNQLDLSLYKQRTEYSCGPASLRIALKLLGVEYDERWLSRRMHTSVKIGTSPSSFRDILRMLNIDLTEIENATIGDIRRFVQRSLPVIVAWNYRDDGHYSVVTGLTRREELSMIEPFDGRLIKIKTLEFLKLWHDPCNHTERWMFALNHLGKRASTR